MASTPENAWDLDAWLASLSLHHAVAQALAPPAGEEAFSYAKTKLKSEVEVKLKAAKLEGLLDYIVEGITYLQTQEVATASELNAKFAIDGSASVELTYGSLDTFQAGLEGFIGPPLMSIGSPELQSIGRTVVGPTTDGPTLPGQMEKEHCQ